MDNKKSFTEGIKFLQNNFEEFKRTIFISYLTWADNCLLREDLILGYMYVNNIEVICILSSYNYICMGYVIATKIDNEEWKLKNNIFVSNKTLDNTFYCDNCNENIDFLKNQFYNRQNPIIEDDEYNSYDLCENCYQEENDKSIFKHIELSEQVNYYGINTYEIIDLKYFTDLKQLYNTDFIIKKAPEIDLEDFKEEREFSKFMFESEEQVTIKDMEKYNDYIKNYSLEDLYID